MDEQFDIKISGLSDIRDSRPSDVPFILATWLRGLRFGNDWYRLIEDKVYFAVYHKVLEQIMSKPSIKIKVACLKDDPEVILGYCVYEDGRIHWVFVKKSWRNIGIAKSLVPSEITTVTHLTEAGKAILLNKRWVFNPFLL